VFDNGAGFCFAFFGALLAGMVPIPLPPPFVVGRREEYVLRTRSILREAGARMVVVDTPFADWMDASDAPGCRVLSASDVEHAAANDAGAFAPHAGAPGETAFLQYTSGSTRDPRGVRLSHSNVLWNTRGIGLAVHARQDETTLCWAPLFHDLGL